MQEKVLLENSNLKTENRNYGIDLLKILSMFMVVVLHVLGRGGVLSSCEPDSLNWHVAWLLEIGSYGAVNCFALVTGYLMVNKKYKSSRIISLWLEVVFYSMISMLILQIFYPQETELKQWFAYLFPVTNSAYWYFTAYFGLFFVMPLINRLYQTLNKKQSLLIIIVGFFLFTFPSLINDAFKIQGGYSMVWLIYMYFVGAHIKKFGILPQIKTTWFILGYVLAIIVTFASVPIIKFVTNLILGREVGAFSLVSYVSPTIVISSICLMIFCSRLNFKKVVLKRSLAFLSPLAFGVYIVHQHSLFFGKFLYNRFAFLGSGNVIVLVLVAIGGAIGIYIFCTVIVYLRSLLFKVCKVDKFTNKLGDKIDGFITNKFLAEKQVSENIQAIDEQSSADQPQTNE